MVGVVNCQHEATTRANDPVNLAQRRRDLLNPVEVVQSGVRYHGVEALVLEGERTDVGDRARQVAMAPARGGHDRRRDIDTGHPLGVKSERGIEAVADALVEQICLQDALEPCREPPFEEARG